MSSAILTAIDQAAAVKSRAACEYIKPGLWLGTCPAHDDHNPSLQIHMDEEKKQVHFRCLAGKCGQKHIIKAVLGLEDILKEEDWEVIKKSVAKDYYSYYEPDGKHCYYREVRWHPKDFTAERMLAGTWQPLPRCVDIPHVYNLPAVIQAGVKGQPIIITEGCKDADSLTALGQKIAVTTNPGGALAGALCKYVTQWAAAVTHGKKEGQVMSTVYLVLDRDKAGVERIKRLSLELKKSGVMDIKIFVPPGEVKDLTEAIEAGTVTAGNLVEQLEKCPECNELEISRIKNAPTDRDWETKILNEIKKTHKK